MWNTTGQICPNDRFEPFLPVEVLDDYDGPRIFTLMDTGGELHLACWSDGDSAHSRFVVVPTSTRTLNFLRNGEISVFDALDQPTCWICDISVNGHVDRCWQADFNAIPRDVLPSQGTLLSPALERPLVDFEGRVRELDKDRLSFELREIHGPVKTQRFVFGKELLDDVFQAFQKDVRVRVAGRAFPVENVAYALAFSNEIGNVADGISTN